MHRYWEAKASIGEVCEMCTVPLVQLHWRVVFIRLVSSKTAINWVQCQISPIILNTEIILNKETTIKQNNFNKINTQCWSEKHKKSHQSNKIQLLTRTVWRKLAMTEITSLARCFFTCEKTSASSSPRFLANFSRRLMTTNYTECISSHLFCQ